MDDQELDEWLRQEAEGLLQWVEENVDIEQELEKIYRQVAL